MISFAFKVNLLHHFEMRLKFLKQVKMIDFNTYLFFCIDLSLKIAFRKFFMTHLSFTFLYDDRFAMLELNQFNIKTTVLLNWQCQPILRYLQ